MDSTHLMYMKTSAILDLLKASACRTFEISWEVAVCLGHPWEPFFGVEELLVERPHPPFELCVAVEELLAACCLHSLVDLLVVCAVPIL
eukprot:15636-Karenia_brevis.AAC.1